MLMYMPRKKSTPKQELWSDISSFLSNMSNLPTVIIGDFNVVLSDLEREHCVYNHRDTDALLSFMQENDLTDIPLSNGRFTWYGPNHRKSRLDRALINSKWNEFGSWSLQGFNRKSSDHRPILLSNSKSDWGPRPFKFFHCWLKDEAFLHNLGKVWQAHPNSSISFRFREVRKYAKEWNLTSNGNIDVKIKNLEKEQDIADDSNAALLTKRKIAIDLEQAYEQKASMMCQISRLNWQLHGEREIQDSSTELSQVETEPDSYMDYRLDQIGSQNHLPSREFFWNISEISFAKPQMPAYFPSVKDSCQP